MGFVRRIATILTCIVLVFFILLTSAFAHSGRTDASGGHRDNKNVSGLGSYHYHCGGYPPHLHVQGYCPYRDTFPSSVSVSASKSSLGIGETSTVSASVSPSNACSTSVTWESSDPSVVQVNGGKISALKFGTATITATTFNGKVGSVKITVKEIVADSVKITGIDNLDTPLYVGGSLQATAEISPENVDNPAITWTSSDPEIATVEDGTITAHSGGSVTITAATANGKTNSVELEIQEIVAEKIAIRAAAAYLVGDEAQLDVEFTPADTSSQEIQWESSDHTIAAINDKGLLRAVAPGEATITAIQKDTRDSVQVQIKPIRVEEVQIAMADGFKGRLKIREVTQLTGTALPENATYRDITWSSSAPEVAEVDSNGIVTAKAAGKAIISAKTADDVESIVTVKVVSKYHDIVAGGVAIIIVTYGIFISLRRVKHRTTK